MKTIEFDTHFYKKLWTLMVPIMVQNLMLALVAVADAFMLGGLDQNYMSQSRLPHRYSSSRTCFYQRRQRALQYSEHSIGASRT